MRVNLILRKKQSHFNSIENIFSTLQPYFKNYTDKICLPHTNSGILNLLKNIIFLYKKKNIKTPHITGHDHYVIYAFKKNKAILTIHDIEFIKRATGLKRFLLKKLWMDWPISRAKVITTISEFSKKEILSLNNYKTPIIVINNPLTLPILPSEKEFNNATPNILHIGTKENKNIYRLIEALEGINCHLTIIGKLNSCITKKLEQFNISFSSKCNLTNDQMILEYKKCDILSFVSTYEGFGLPIIEAQATGRAVITSNITSIPEITNDSALLVNPFDVKDIRNGIIKLIADEKLRNFYIQKGYQNVKKFLPSNIADQYIELYKHNA